LPVTDNGSRFFEQLGAGGDKAIAAGTYMFDVWALDLPNNTPEPWSTEEREVWIGYIRTTSEFTQSLWGDERLFFEHSRLDDDFDEQRGGRRAFDVSQTPRWDGRRDGQWDRSLNVPTPSD
jgi:hypothetical protein